MLRNLLKNLLKNLLSKKSVKNIFKLENKIIF